MKTDQELGSHVQAILIRMGIETPMKVTPNREGADETLRTCFTQVMNVLELNPNDDSLKGTPERIAKMYLEEIFTGLSYANFPKCTTVENKMDYDELITVTANVNSICEHHFVPFIGKATIGYIPRNKVIGLSKIPRIVDFFSRRPQIQERLTVQISACLEFILETDDIAVVIECEHLCVRLRGVKDSTSKTTTSKMAGRFRSVPELRAEFLVLNR
jgi:GTP cyclohydrolase I